MQVVRTAIGNFRVNTGHLALGFQPILATEFFLGKTALVFRQLSRVLCAMAGIAGFKTIRGDKQIFNADINTHLFIGDGQQRGIKFTQARHKIASCLIFGNGNGRGVREKLTTPFDVQRSFTLSQFQFTVLKGEGSVSEFCRLMLFFGFKDGVFSPTFKEVFERRLLVSQALLQRHARNVIQEGKLRFLFESGEACVSTNIVHLFFYLIVSIRAVTQEAVVHITHTSERLSQQLFLLLVRVKAELVGALSFHSSHCETEACEAQPQKIANLTGGREKRIG